MPAWLSVLRQCFFAQPEREKISPPGVESVPSFNRNSLIFDFFRAFPGFSNLFAVSFP
jgi:hypothetical protein